MEFRDYIMPGYPNGRKYIVTVYAVFSSDDYEAIVHSVSVNVNE